MSYLGKDIRLSRLLNDKSGHLLAITVDHSISRGIFENLMPIDDVIAKIVAGKPDSLTMHKGIAQNCFAPFAGKTSLILKASSFSPYQPTMDTQTADVEEAVRLGADAVSMGLILGGEFQPQQVYALGKLTKEAERWGMPVVAHIYPKGEFIPTDKRTSYENLRYCVRLGAELGVDVIKTSYSGSAETFAKVVEACPTRVVAAGGDNFADPKAFLQQTRDLMDAGAAGVTYGRGVWEYKDPTRMVMALNCIVNDDGTVEDAMTVLNG
ncbi:class I fructose-bisphosphate aldolase [Pseudoflavonifractor sp. MSJ-37]|uniref:class I fructose-bisphosphate aldolase n=1 Tax=Pseudoflavonifractor sp. MSJ-37 TaxID=2841531 RepID=UPI001C0F5778|nr:2-amino-3,7-dideoxy-D-threo-hept-6-ulosonate synthase [Pseudoflavonifractor sp. MSJ-37]MBU5434092.1 fructose-bisphosphate aldolase [Pseudoflavonifractor sp. MSJ-37]